MGIHITPLTDGNILIGPNAIPVFNKDVQGKELSDWISLFPNLFYHSKLFLSNSQNYRMHALNELTFFVLDKFKEETSKFLDFPDKIVNEMFMSKKNYGIRPQLYDKEKNKLVDDFIYDIDENSINIVNAVSPAFTSCLALSEKIIKHYLIKLSMPICYLDRDGVFNHHLPYVGTLDRFIWYSEIIDILKILKGFNYRFILVTNQSGIGRGYYSLMNSTKLMK